jgi:hypothetical protein
MVSKYRFLIIVLVVILVSGGVYIATNTTQAPSQTQPNSSPIPTTDPTANWKTYRNVKVGFEMKYPPSYQTPYVPAASKNVDGSEYNSTISFDEPSISE